MGRPRAGGGREEEDTDLGLNFYEAERNAMLEENRKRMLELGLLEAVNDVSRTATSLKAARPVKPKQARGTSDSLRRSSRLQSITTVCYKEKPEKPERLPRFEARHFARYSTKHLKSMPVYTGPVRRSSRLQATSVVSYKDQLGDDTVLFSQLLSSDSDDDW